MPVERTESSQNRRSLSRLDNHPKFSGPETLKAPFPYFGGKSKIAKRVWGMLGQPKHYIEPFFGSGAVLLARPYYDPERSIETVCDVDGHLANVWRSLQFDPEEVAKWCDWPVNHVDLAARRRRLRERQLPLRERLLEEDDYCDPKLAGYWIWATSCWIGSGLMSEGLQGSLGGKIPWIAHSRRGVHIGQVPYISGEGMGINTQKRTHTGGCVQDPYHTDIYGWFRRLSERLRNVRVVCGDWSRVCGGNWQGGMGTVGIFFDPPYGVWDRTKNLYANDSMEVSSKVREWCASHGGDPNYRIVLAGYQEEHKELIEAGWNIDSWVSNGGYGQGQKRMNRFREALFYSPHCVRTQTSLF